MVSVQHLMSVLRIEHLNFVLDLEVNLSLGHPCWRFSLTSEWICIYFVSCKVIFDFCCNRCNFCVMVSTRSSRWWRKECWFCDSFASRCCWQAKIKGILIQFIYDWCENYIGSSWSLIAFYLFSWVCLCVIRLTDKYVDWLWWYFLDLINFWVVQIILWIVYLEKPWMHKQNNSRSCGSWGPIFPTRLCTYYRTVWPTMIKFGTVIHVGRGVFLRSHLCPIPRGCSTAFTSFPKTLLMPATFDLERPNSVY